MKEAADRAIRLLSLAATIGMLALTLATGAYLLKESAGALKKLKLKLLTDPWDPGRNYYGLAPTMITSLLLTALSLLFAFPPALLASLYLVFYVRSSRIKEQARALLEILAGIPSVVYGAWGLYILVPFMNRTIGPLIGRALGSTIGIFEFKPSYTGNLLAAAIVLAVMILPIMAFAFTETFAAIPQAEFEACLACGATRWQAIKTYVLPRSTSGILMGIVLAFGRAIGETMAVTMVAGVAIPPQVPKSLFSPATPVTSLILVSIGTLTPGMLEWGVLFSAALLLLILSAASVIIAKTLARRGRKGMIRARPLLYKPSGRLARLEERGAILIMGGSMAAIAGTLAWIVGGVVLRGGRALAEIGIQAFTKPLRVKLLDEGIGFAGGLINDIVGSVVLSALATAIALPFGLLVAIYLVEYAGEGRLRRLVEDACDSLSTLPSIVLGMIGLAIFVIGMRRLTGGLSILSGSLTLAIMLLPYMVRSLEEALSKVPRDLKEAVYALGGTRAEAILVALRQISPTIVATAAFGFMRALSESAPVILTAGGTSMFVPRSLRDQAGNLAVRVYVLGFEMSIYARALDYMYAAALILLMILALTMLLSRLVARRLRKYTVR